jgi:hypothetical protein
VISVNVFCKSVRFNREHTSLGERIALRANEGLLIRV